MQVDWLRARRWHVRTWFNYFKLHRFRRYRYQRLISRRTKALFRKKPRLAVIVTASLQHLGTRPQVRHYYDVWYNLSLKKKDEGYVIIRTWRTVVHSDEAAYILRAHRLRQPSHTTTRPASFATFCKSDFFFVDAVSHCVFHDVLLKCSFQSDVSISFYPSGDPFCFDV